MAEEPTIKKFSAADIEKYHRGELTPAERHALEKAALDDPFLADALEGYALPGVNVQTDLDELRRRLNDRTSAGRVNPLGAAPRRFPWLRAAVVIAFLAGAALLSYQLIFDRPNNEMAGTVTPSQPGKAADTITPQPTAVPGKPAAETTRSMQVPVQPAPDNATTIPAEKGSTNPPVAIVEEKSIAGEAEKSYDEKMLKDQAAEKKAADVTARSKQEITTTEEDTRVAAGAPPRQENVAVPARKNNNIPAPQPVNVFRGRVTDAQNTGVPFARVYNPADNDAGTYTDAAGNFAITSPDTVLTVQVKALGFEQTNVQLNQTRAANQVMLRDDRNLSEVVISNSRANSNVRNRSMNQPVEEAEPADGWENYDSYLVNNLQLPSDFSRKQTGGEVLVSFEVDAYGEPVRIRIEKSLCKSCDREAIRLIKDGPRWKYRAGAGRTTVSVVF